MGENVHIVGVSLLKNEEYSGAWALMNAAAFCDRVIVMDNRSQDRTRRAVEAVAGVHRHIEIVDVRNARRTHKYLEPLAGTRSWIFAIDGDEIHDPAGLAAMRRRLLAGCYDRYRRVTGHMVNVAGFHAEEGIVSGYSRPEALGNCRLYNFHAIESWRSKNERLHGGKIVFRPGYDRTKLHLCFMPRSSLDKAGDLAGGELGRKNPAELYKERFLYQRLRRAVRRHLKSGGVADFRDYKCRYAQGPIGDFDITGFGRPSDFRAVDPHCDEAMAVLRAATERWGSGPASACNREAGNRQ